MASRDNQEIGGGVLADLVEKARHTADTGKTPTTMFRGIHNDEQDQCVLDEEGIRSRGMCSGQRKKRTIHERKRNINRLADFPRREVADPILIER